MSLVAALVLLLAVAGGAILWARRRLDGMSFKEKKALLKKSVNNIYLWCEHRGLLARTPAFDRDYLQKYPALRVLEDHHATIREECLTLLDIKDRLTDMAAMGGTYTQAGIHTIRWKTFMFKSGEFLEANCRLAPKTAALLRKIPGMYTAFFSVLEPHQQIPPHWGYYKGFVRYHLGVIIPNDNAGGECYLRVNGNRDDNARRDPTLIERGETYYWKNGEGIVFDDNYLHDAANTSDQIRVVLWLDLRRQMPFYLQLFNVFCLAVAHREKSVRKIRENALVEA
jgi:aspartyl/asparaginyl beta-hydroxylase (cupin superfamily)